MQNCDTWTWNISSQSILVHLDLRKKPLKEPDLLYNGNLSSGWSQRSHQKKKAQPCFSDHHIIFTSAIRNVLHAWQTQTELMIFPYGPSCTCAALTPYKCKMTFYTTVMHLLWFHCYHITSRFLIRSVFKDQRPNVTLIQDLSSNR